MFENPRRGRQVSNFTTNVPKILDLKSSSEQIFFRKLSLGAPELSNKLTNAVRTIEEPLVEFVPQTFKHYLQNFLLKATQQFVEILTTTYIFQSHGSVYNIWN